MGTEGDTGAVGDKRQLDLHPVESLVEGDWWVCEYPEHTIAPNMGASFDERCRACMIAAQAYVMICGEAAVQSQLVDDNADDLAPESLLYMVRRAEMRELIPARTNLLRRPSP